MTRWLSFALVLVFAILVNTASCATDDPGASMPGVVQLNEANFEHLVGKDKAALVEFYAPWCGHCKSMAPEYATLGAALEKSEGATNLLLLGKVDATQERALGKRFDVTGFPTILYFAPGSLKPTAYQGGRTAEEFARYLEEHVTGLHLIIPTEPQFAKELDTSNFNAVAKDPSKSVLVMFYAPWCGYCKAFKPTYSKLAKVFENDKDVVIARINADKDANRNIAAEYNVKSLPTLYFFPKGVDAQPVEYTRDREIEDLITYVNENAGTHRLVNGDLSWDYGVVVELAKAAALVATSTGEKAQTSVDALKVAADKLPESESVKYYVRVAERIAANGPSYVENELARLKRTLNSSVIGERRDYMLKRVNILTSIKKHMNEVG